ncbi:hypothetical protein [Nonomuraea typhae]|uniref:hypothetical protein n=1 Tax=Nonomuraea typhae TaxID=2603600 RepID=UPI0012F95ED3|nr:hypothetical protein [Nonomuraea typhae]
MTLTELQARYGGVWEFFPDLARGVAATRRHQILSDEDYRRGVLLVLLAPDLSGLKPRLEEQAKLDGR